MIQLPTFLFKEVVSIQKITGYGESGPSFGTSFDVKCMIERKQRIIVTKEGKEIASSHTITLKDYQDIPSESKVSFDNRDFTVIEARPVKHLGRNISLEILVQ